jgi:hypothetical protein
MKLLDLLKPFYEAFGTPYPRASQVVVTILGALIAGSLWWFVGKQLEKDHQVSTAPSQVSGPASTMGDKSPAVTGNGNTIQYDQTPSPSDKKPEPPAKEGAKHP